MSAGRELAVGTVGPYQMLTAFAVAATRGWTLSGARIFHYWRSTPELLDCEKRLASPFAAELVADLGTARHSLDRPLIRASRRLDRIARRLVAGPRAWSWTQELKEIGVGRDARVILPYRASLEETLLSHYFDRGEIVYAADGASFGLGQPWTLPRRLRVWRLGCRDAGTREIWGLAAFHSTLSRFGRARAIAEERWRDVLATARRGAGLDHQLGSAGRCVLLQCFSEFGMMEASDELEFWQVVIRAEAEVGEPVLVKPHPRDSAAKALELAERVRVYPNVKVLTDPALACFPIEVLLDPAGTTRLAGAYSTPLFAAASDPGREVVMYDCEHLPARLRRAAIEEAHRRGIEVVPTLEGL